MREDDSVTRGHMHMQAHVRVDGRRGDPSNYDYSKPS